MVTNLSLVERLPDTKANATVVERLEEMLADARAGNVVGVALIGYDKGRFATQMVVPGENPILLLGTMHAAAYRLAKYIDEHFYE